MDEPTRWSPLREHRRSVAFVESRGDTWACFLVTRPDAAGTWHGWFSFRPRRGDGDEDEVRTTDIFIEASEAEIHDRARTLGRPLLAGLLESALYTRGLDGREADGLRGRFHRMLVESSTGLSGDWSGSDPEPEPDRERLRSLYASYRLDQVAHLVSLVDPADFQGAVDAILDGERTDFLSKDRMQYAMMVVDHLERLLPLPDFETWTRDFLANREEYRLYTHALHREGVLP